jgi:hypothetical protein
LDEAYLMNRHLLSAILCMTALGGMGAAIVRADDQLEERRARQKVAAQALEQDIRAAVEEARRLKGDSAQALKILEEALAKLKPDDPLDIAKRAELRVLIEGTIKDVKNPPQRPSFLDRLPPTSAEVDKKISAEIETILKLQKEGRSAEAQALANKLVSEHPSIVAVELTKNTVSTKDSVDADRAASDAKSRGFVDQMSSIDKAATPIKGDIEYDPERWKNAQKRAEKLRDKIVPRTAMEKQLIAVLNQRLTQPISFKDVPLDQVLSFLANELKINVTIRKGTLDELRLNNSTPVSATVPAGTTKNNALDAILGGLGLTIIIKNEQIMAVSAEEAANTLVTRIIPVDGLVGGPLGGTPEQVIKFIEEQTGPDNWKSNGGPGTIVYYPNARVLIVRNTASVISILEKKGY